MAEKKIDYKTYYDKIINTLNTRLSERENDHLSAKGEARNKLGKIKPMSESEVADKLVDYMHTYKGYLKLGEDKESTRGEVMGILEQIADQQDLSVETFIKSLKKGGKKFDQVLDQITGQIERRDIDLKQKGVLYDLVKPHDYDLHKGLASVHTAKAKEYGIEKDITDVTKNLHKHIIEHTNYRKKYN